MSCPPWFTYVGVVRLETVFTDRQKRVTKELREGEKVEVDGGKRTQKNTSKPVRKITLVGVEDGY